MEKGWVFFFFLVSLVVVTTRPPGISEPSRGVFPWRVGGFGSFPKELDRTEGSRRKRFHKKKEKNIRKQRKVHQCT